MDNIFIDIDLLLYKFRFQTIFLNYFLEKSSFAAMMLTYTRTTWLPCTQPEAVRELEIATLLLLEAANSFTVYNEYILTLSPIAICFIYSKKKMKKSLLIIFADADLEIFLGGGAYNMFFLW